MSNKYFLRGALSLICLIFLYTNQSFALEENLTEVQPAEAQRFANAIYLIKKYYVKKADDKKLFNAAIAGMLNELDPHSSYLSEKELSDFETIASGEFGGLGLEITKDHQAIKIITALEDSPAAKKGLKSGDYIMQINSKILQGISLSEAARLLRGKEGSQVELTILRKGASKPLHFTLIREKIHIKSLKSHLFNKNYGYVHLTQFQENTAADLQEAIKNLQKQAQAQGSLLEGFILDLRNNPGGLLTSAIEVSDTFLDAKRDEKKLIVYTRGQNEDSNFEATANPGDLLKNTPMIVLINNGSASAAEIVAGALKDNHRALIVGTASFGKGSVQTIIPLSEKEAIKLTTAFYYTPAGISIQARGIQPNIYIPEIDIPKTNSSKGEINLSEKSLPKHLQEKEQNNPHTSTQSSSQTKTQMLSEDEVSPLMYEDYQLYSAFNILQGLSMVPEAGAGRQAQS